MAAITFEMLWPDDDESDNHDSVSLGKTCVEEKPVELDTGKKSEIPSKISCLPQCNAAVDSCPPPSVDLDATIDLAAPVRTPDLFGWT